MAIEIKQQLRLSQQLVMTPQLQQAIKLLQLSRLELADVVTQELQENPVLEVSEDADEDLPREVVADSHEAEAPVAETEAVADETSDHREASDAEKIADIDWQSYAEAYPQTGFQGEARDDDERRSLEGTLTRRETLAEHLDWQLQLSEFSEAERAAATCIIGNLDEDGYLRADVEELARAAGVPHEVVEAALRKLQRFDPTGVAARDLRECLLIQIDTLASPADPLVRTLVADHLDALQRRDFRGIARVLGVTIEEVAAAARLVGRLEPRPGRPFGGEDPIYIIPDIYVYKIGDDLHVVLNEDGLPKLKINQLYRDVLARGGQGVAKDTRDYVQDKVRSAMWLIKSIHQRQRTIYKVMTSIIKHQRDFFERGVQFLKPLNLRDVAEDIGMHESTVSRVTTNKYAHTPQGIFELKFFFNSSINRVDGDAIASESVKEKIRRIITAEDPRRPLSDQRIAEMLRSANIDIARRTVTKYREAMNILSSTKRRRVG
jgi:RNA polymerase sigma-54 factor